MSTLLTSSHSGRPLSSGLLLVRTTIYSYATPYWYLLSISVLALSLAQPNAALAEDLYLHCDALQELESISSEDDIDWAAFLGRSDYLSEAWRSVDSANAQWKEKRSRLAIAKWIAVAQQFRDTDAALAALDNAARAEMSLKNASEAASIRAIILLLPTPQEFDNQSDVNNFRHAACIALSEYYESCQEYALAERFLAQALSVDTMSVTCGVFGFGLEIEYRKRLTMLRILQGKHRVQ